MVLPSKHVAPRNTLAFVGAELLPRLSSPHSVSELWDWYHGLRHSQSYDRFVLALDFLYTLGLISVDARFVIHRTLK